MKRFAALAVLISSVAVANQNVTVTGTGSDPESARQDALHQASMRFCPSAVVNDREYQNESMTRNNLTVYNGCLVKNYKVLNEQGRLGSYMITINAEVIPSQLGSRIINQHPEWFYFDLGQHNDRVAQLTFRQENAINLIDEVFYEFTNNAFQVKNTPYKITYTGTQGYLHTDFVVSWNKNFIVALEEMLNLIHDKKGSMFNNDGYQIKVNSTHVFDNFILPNRIRDHLSAQRPVVRLQILDSHENVYVNACFQLRNWSDLYNPLGSTLIFNWGTSVGDNIRIAIPQNIPYDAKTLLDVVPSSYSFCKVFY